MAKTSSISFAKELAKFVTKETVKQNKKAFQQKITASFEKIKQEMVSEFLNHPISVEIRGGISAENSSNTLEGYGNLFTFIGFDRDSDPLRPIIDLLESSKIDYDRDSDSGFLIKIYIPSANDIFSVTPMPWASGRSWAEGVERGISGFGYYLNIDTDASRSSAGIEAKSVIRRGKFKNTSYISALINKYTKKLQQINNAVVFTNIL
jgi:hypothetical protein